MLDQCLLIKPLPCHATYQLVQCPCSTYKNWSWTSESCNFRFRGGRGKLEKCVRRCGRRGGHATAARRTLTTVVEVKPVIKRITLQFNIDPWDRCSASVLRPPVRQSSGHVRSVIGKPLQQRRRPYCSPSVVNALNGWVTGSSVKRELQSVWRGRVRYTPRSRGSVKERLKVAITHELSAPGLRHKLNCL